MTSRSRPTRRPLSKTKSRTPRPLAKSSGTTRKPSPNKAKPGAKTAKVANRSRSTDTTRKAKNKAVIQAPTRKAKNKAVIQAPTRKAKSKAVIQPPTRKAKSKAVIQPPTRKAKAPTPKATANEKKVSAAALKKRAPQSGSERARPNVPPKKGPLTRPEKRRGRAVKNPSKRKKNGDLPVEVVDPRQLALPFASPSGSKRPVAEASDKQASRTKPVTPTQKPRPKLPEPAPVASPVPVSMTRLLAALEKETQRRDKAPDSTVRGLPVGVRRGRLMPRSEQNDENALSSRSTNLDALKRYLAGAGVVADAEAQHGYLIPWLNGSDVLAFVPADRSAMIGAGSIAVANQKKVLIVLPTEDNVAEQVNLLRSAGFETKTLPLEAEERTLEARTLARTSSLLMVMSVERLQLDEVSDDVRPIGFDLLAIDECQRVSEIAPDFDPGLERLAELAPRIGRPPTLALLRAVPPSVRSDLPHRLGLRNPLRVDLSPVNDALSLDVISTDPGRRLSLLTEQLRMSQLPAVVLGYSMADVNDIHNALSQAGFNARRLEGPTSLPSIAEPAEQVVWVVSTGRVPSPVLQAHSLVHFRSPPSLEQYCRDLGWVTHTSGHSRSLMLVTNDDESLVKGTLERLRPRAEDLVGLASVLTRQGANASTVLIDSLCAAVGMNRVRIETLVGVFARAGWLDHGQDWVRLRTDCPDLVDRARNLGARLKTAKERDAQRLRSVSAYVVSRGCRQETLRRHFGTASSRPCGLCDACRSGRVATPVQAERSPDEGLTPITGIQVSSTDEPMSRPNGIMGGEQRPMRGRIITI